MRALVAGNRASTDTGSVESGELVRRVAPNRASTDTGSVEGGAQQHYYWTQPGFLYWVRVCRIGVIFQHSRYANRERSLDYAPHS